LTISWPVLSLSGPYLDQSQTIYIHTCNKLGEFTLKFNKLGSIFHYEKCKNLGDLGG